MGNPKTTPSFPAGLRLASPSDIHRLGSVAFSGASTTSEHKWLRPHATSYPQDTISDFQSWFISCLRSDDHILLVAEDAYLPDEESKSNVTVPQDHDGTATSSSPSPPSSSSETVIVGFALYQLRGMNKRYGQFQQTSGAFPMISASQGRDRDFDHGMDYQEVIRPLELDTFIECGMTLETLIVHPTYWGKGHGKKLITWATDLATIDGINIGVTATDMGIPVYKKLGFESRDKFVINGDKLSPEGVRSEIMMFSPPAHKTLTPSTT